MDIFESIMGSPKQTNIFCQSNTDPARWTKALQHQHQHRLQYIQQQLWIPTPPIHELHSLYRAEHCVQATNHQVLGLSRAPKDVDLQPLDRSLDLVYELTAHLTEARNALLNSERYPQYYPSPPPILSVRAAALPPQSRHVPPAVNFVVAEPVA